MKILATFLLLLAGLHAITQVEGVAVDITSHLTHLNTHRYPNTEHEEARKRTVDYITERFEEYGLRVDYQLLHAFASPYPAYPSVCPDGPSSQACLSYVEGVNVIGLSGPEREEAGAVVVVGAAYDTAGVGSPVYDNGAGVAVLLEVARLYRSRVPRPRLSTLFVAFDLSVESYYAPKEKEEEEDSGEDVGSGGGDREEGGGRHKSEDGRTGGAGRSGGGGLPGGWSLVQDYLRSYLQQNTSRFGGAIVLGPLMNVNHRDHSQEFDGPLMELFPAAHEQVAAGGYKGDFVAMVTKGSDGDEATLTLRRQVMESYKEVGGTLVEFNLGNRSHTLLPPALPPRQAAHFWGSTHMGKAAPLPAVLLTDTEVYRRWPHYAPAPSPHLTGEQRVFLHTTVTSLTHFLARRDTHEEPADWVAGLLVAALVVIWVINCCLLCNIVHLRRLCASRRAAKQGLGDHCSAEASLISKGVKYRPEDSN